MTNPPHPLAGMVKPLEWDGSGKGNYPTWWAYGIDFSAKIDKGAASMYGEYPLFINGFWDNKKHKTLEAAKSAAQADYEARILTAIPADAVHALVGAAVEDAALACEGEGQPDYICGGDEQARRIRALTPTAARDALAHIERAAEARGMREAWPTVRAVICSQDWTDCDGDVFCDTIEDAILAAADRREKGNEA